MLANKKLLSIITIFFVGSTLLLLFLTTLVKGGTNLPITAFTIAIMLLLLFATLFLTNMEQEKALNTTDHYTKKLEETERELENLQVSHEETVERRTFEISVVNASLNREIAERIQAESEGKALQKRMELILESAGEGIFGLDTDGKVTFVNKAAALMLGWEVEDIIGSSHHDLVHHTHKDGSVHPERDCPIYQAYKDGKVYSNSDDIFWAKDKRSFPVEYMSTPIREGKKITGAVVVFRNISKRIQTEQESRRMQQHMKIILDSAGEGIFGLDVNGNITFVNKAASLMLGWEVDELIGKAHHDLVHHTHKDGTTHFEKDCPIYSAYRDGKVHFSSDDVFWTKEGSSFRVEYVSTPIVENSRLNGAVVVFRDADTFS